MAAPGGVVYCFDFQTAVLEKKKVEEKFEARSVLMYHFKKQIISHFHKSVSAKGMNEHFRSMQMNSDDKPVH